MDIINIGNDIKVIFKLKNVTYSELSNVKCLNCYFIKYEHSYNLDRCNMHVKKELFPQYYNPTEYTIHSCGFPMYNVVKNNTCNINRYCGFSVNSHKFYHNDTFRCNKLYGCNIPSEWTTEDPLTVYFPGHDLCEPGIYRLVVRLVLKEEGWGFNNVHEYLIDYGNIFDIVMYGGTSGNITIDLSNGKTEDSIGDSSWYIGQISTTRTQFKALSDEELISNSIKIPDSEKSKSLIINKSCWYILIPSDIFVKDAKYTVGDVTTHFTKDDIINKEDFDLDHADIFINNNIYKVYGYRNYGFSDTPALSTFNIE